MGIYTPPKAQEMDISGDPVSGGKLNFYEVGTSTRKDTYQDKALTTTHANPVVADSSGRWEPIYLDGNYKIVLTDANDVEIWTEDDISGGVEQLFSETEDFTATGSVDSTYDKKHIRFNSASGITANLLDIASAGEGFSFSLINDGTGTVTLDPNASEQINNANTIAIPPGSGGVCIAGPTEWSYVGLWNGSVSATTIDITGATSGTVVASDEFIFSDADDSNTVKKDTVQGILALVYPVGAYYFSDVSTSPATVLGFGTWTAVEGLMLIGADGTYTAGSEGGSATTTQTTSQIALHGHPIRVSTTTGGAQDPIGGLMLEGNNVANYPAHTGTPADTAGDQVGGTGSSSAMTTISPYRAVYIWRRTA